MGASSSGLLDEAKTSHIKGLVESSFESFSVFYRQQYPVAYFGHLQQEVEPKKQERGLLLTQRPRSDPDDVLYQGSARFSTWYEPIKKGKDKYVVLKRNYNLEIHESQETFSRGCAAKLVLQPTGGTALTSENEAQTLLEQMCAGILNGVKEDSSPVTSPSEGFTVYLHLPHIGHNCFLFQNVDQQHHFLSALKSCIRHHNLDPWTDASYENQAFVHALRLYRQDKGHYESWEMQLGSEEQVLAAQLMEEVLPWLQSQLQAKVKGKKMDRIRMWLATVSAAYNLVLEQLKAGLDTLKEECCKTASDNQGLIRANLDQITSSQSFLVDKIQGCVSERADNVCSESISPYMSSILEALTENIGSAFKEMRQTLQSHINAALAEKNGGSEVTKKVSTLNSTGLEHCYQQVEELKDKLSNLKERFGLSNSERLVHCAHLDMEKLLDSAVYTFELFLRTSARLQPAQFTLKTDRAQERVLKQLDYDSRLVQKRLYEDALLQITLPTLTQRMDRTWRTELQQFEQYIFSDFTSFILVQNVYEDVLRAILSKEIEKALQEAASKTSSTLLLDTSDLGLSQYSLLGQTPAPSAPSSPTLQPRDFPLTVPTQESESAPTLEEKLTVETNNGTSSDFSITQTNKTDPPVIVVSQTDECATAETSCEEKVKPVIDLLGYESSDSEPLEICDAQSDSDPLEVLESLTNLEDVPDECVQSSPPETPATSDLTSLESLPKESPVVEPLPPSQPPTPQTENPIKISLETLTEAIVCDALEDVIQERAIQQPTDRAVYLTGPIKVNWEVENQKEAAKIENDHSPPAESAVASNTESGEEEVIVKQREPEEKMQEKVEEQEKFTEDVSSSNNCETEELQSPEPIESQTETSTELPLDSVAAIRDLVIEVTEVELTITPSPDNIAP